MSERSRNYKNTSTQNETQGKSGRDRRPSRGSRFGVLSSPSTNRRKTSGERSDESGEKEDGETVNAIRTLEERMVGNRNLGEE